MGLVGRRLPEGGGHLAVGAIGGSFVLSGYLFYQVLRRGALGAGFESVTVPGYVWLPGLSEIRFGLLIDNLSALLLLLVSLRSLLIVIYSLGYMREEAGKPRYYAEISLFVASMLGTVSADNFLQLLIFWEITGLCSYLLIGSDDPSRRNPGSTNHLDLLADATTEPGIVRCMIGNLYDDDVAFPAVSHDCVEEPPERRQVLDVEVLKPILGPQTTRDPILLHDFAMKTVREQDRAEGADASGNRAEGWVRTPLKATEAFGCGTGQDDVSRAEPHYRRSPFRIASRSCGEASGTQTSPLLPSATIPSSPRKASAAFRLGRVVEWPQRARVARTRLRLIGPSDCCKTPRTYSIVSRVGFAPGLAYLSRGTFAACAIQDYYMYPSSICILQSP